MKKQVKKYNAEEKAKVAIEAITGEMTVAQITSKYGVHANQKEAVDFMVTGFKSKSGQQDTSQEELIKSLFEQIGQLTVERDWLKKKSRVFGLGG